MLRFDKRKLINAVDNILPPAYQKSLDGVDWTVNLVLPKDPISSKYAKEYFVSLIAQLTEVHIINGGNQELIQEYRTQAQKQSVNSFTTQL